MALNHLIIRQFTPESYDVTYELLTVLNFDINDLELTSLKLNYPT